MLAPAALWKVTAQISHVPCPGNTHTLHTGIHTACMDLHIIVLTYHTYSTSRHRLYFHTSHTHSHPQSTCPHHIHLHIHHALT